MTTVGGDPRREVSAGRVQGGCIRESDVVDAVVGGQWPKDIHADLRAHVDGCETCRELVAVAAPLRDDHARMLAAARVPTAGAVWWRAQVRARLEAPEAALRPMRLFSALALVVTLGLVAAAAGLVWPLVSDRVASWSLPLPMGFGMSAIALRLGISPVAALATVGIAAVAASIAVAVALRDAPRS